MPDYVDLKITDDDLTLDAGGEPELIFDKDCITQDIKHLIRESGLLVEIVGQRDAVKIRGHLKKLVLLIEADVRLIPGTVKITQQNTDDFIITAITYKYGNINLNVVS